MSNVLLVILDDVGPELTSAYGLSTEQVSSPTLEALAARGVRYTRAWATPWCSTTRFSILTGQQPGKHGLGRAVNLGVPGAWSLPRGSGAFDTLPARLGQAQVPWSSGLAGKWHLTPLDDRPTTGPLDAGFDRYLGAIGNLQLNHATDLRPQGYYNWERIEDGEIDRSSTYATTADIDDALRLSRELPPPWLVWVGLRAAHFPYQTPPVDLHEYGDVAGDPYRGTRALFQAADTEIGRLLDGLEADGVLDETLVIVLGDNGTTGSAQSGPWAESPGQKSTVYEAGVRVPLIVAGPGVVGEGRVVHDLVHVSDLYVTVLEMAGLSPGPGVDGVSLWPGLRGVVGRPQRPFVYTETFSPNGVDGAPETRQEALWDGRFKLIRADGVDRLYDLADPRGAPDGRWVEGDDLLVDEPLSEEAQGAYATLSTRLDAGIDAPR